MKRVNSKGMLRPDNRDYVAEARAAIAELLAQGEKVKAHGIAVHCKMSDYNACQSLRFLRSTGELD